MLCDAKIALVYHKLFINNGNLSQFILMLNCDKLLLKEVLSNICYSDKLINLGKKLCNKKFTLDPYTQKLWYLH